MEFDKIIIDLDNLFQFIKSIQRKPILETDLLKEYFTEYEEVMSKGVNIDTFKMHFVLYHYLHKLRRKLLVEKSEYFIHIKYIYINLIKKPEKGKCEYFNEEFESFCEEASYIDKNGNYTRFCPFHKEIEEKKKFQLSNIDISNYYINFDNYYKMNENDLEKTMNGIYKYIKSKDIIEESCDILGVSIDTPLEQIHQRFKHLSKKFHPDLNKEEFVEEKYKKINNAYQTIRDYLETFK